MKTPPRDHLLGRHAAASPALDQLRRAALHDLAPVPARALFAALFRPHARTWAALAALWVILIATQLHLSPPSANSNNPATPIADWRQNQTQLYAFLTENSPRF